MIRKNNIYYIVLGLLIGVFIWLAVMSHHTPYFRFDLAITRFLQRGIDESAFPWQGLSYFVSFFGITVVATILILSTALVFALNRLWRESIFIILLPLASAINYFTKTIVDRPRPDGSLIKIIEKQFDPSFPSGHTVFYTVFFGFLIAAMWHHTKISRWLKISVTAFSIFMIVSVSFSRIYLGAHWASDVLAGYLLGGICLLILLFGYYRN